MKRNIARTISQWTGVIFDKQYDKSKLAKALKLQEVLAMP